MGNRGRGILQEKLGTGEGGGGGLFYMKVKKEVEGVLIVDSQVKVGKEKGNFFVKLALCEFLNSQSASSLSSLCFFLVKSILRKIPVSQRKQSF